MLDRRECAGRTSGKRMRTVRAQGSRLWGADKPLGGHPWVSPVCQTKAQQVRLDF
jgi:hypothetical protein